MIISVTGKPCSGKGTVCKLFCEKYNFERISIGELQRQYAKERGLDILTYQQTQHIFDSDKIVDGKIVEIGKARLNDNIIFDARLAWHFIPKSFKVFLDVDWQTAGERLLGTNRETENGENLEDAIQKLKDRWETENKRYKMLYNTDNLNLNNYDLVINTSDKTPEEIVEIIYKNYKKFQK
ncbi:MAG: hypothetical protein E7374_00430 [Clostridiales bacterium]|nr:hypothetical protein [Clostridiales bacterium]